MGNWVAILQGVGNPECTALSLMPDLCYQGSRERGWEPRQGVQKQTSGCMITGACPSQRAMTYRQMEWPPLARVATPMKKLSRPLGLPF